MMLTEVNGGSEHCLGENFLLKGLVTTSNGVKLIYLTIPAATIFSISQTVATMYLVNEAIMNSTPVASIEEFAHGTVLTAMTWAFYSTIVQGIYISCNRDVSGEMIPWSNMNPGEKVHTILGCSAEVVKFLLLPALVCIAHCSGFSAIGWIFAVGFIYSSNRNFVNQDFEAPWHVKLPVVNTLFGQRIDRTVPEQSGTQPLPVPEAGGDENNLEAGEYQLQDGNDHEEDAAEDEYQPLSPGHSSGEN